MAGYRPPYHQTVHDSIVRPGDHGRRRHGRGDALDTAPPPPKPVIRRRKKNKTPKVTERDQLVLVALKGSPGILARDLEVGGMSVAQLRSSLGRLRQNRLVSMERVGGDHLWTATEA